MTKPEKKLMSMGLLDNNLIEKYKNNEFTSS